MAHPTVLNTAKPELTHYMTSLRISNLNRMLAKLQELLDEHLALCNEYDWYEENFLAENTEETMGFVFLACQVFISGTVGNVIGRDKFTYKEKEKLLKNAPQFKGFRTKIELINAAANYYKHKDESELSGDTLKIMQGFGLLEKDFPLITTLEELSEDRTVATLSEYLIGWRNHLFNS